MNVWSKLLFFDLVNEIFILIRISTELKTTTFNLKLNLFIVSNSSSFSLSLSLSLSGLPHPELLLSWKKVRHST